VQIAGIADPQRRLAARDLHDGLDLQKLILDRTELPVIFITGHGSVSMTVQAMKAGAIEFLTKPLEEETLLDAMRHAFERSHAALQREARLRSLRDRYSETTVKAHRGKLMRKMNACSLASLINMTTNLSLEGAVSR